MEYPQVVRVFATVQEPDYDAPWQTDNPSQGTGSGVLVGPGEILTGAHVVADATFLQVQEASQPDKVVARVEAVCHDADLALLQVDEPGFAEGVEPARLDDLPKARDRVAVVGFPVGGEEVSITEGVVSRVEIQQYSHSQRHLLAVTVDAAINEGNSGGPVFRGGRVVGLAFQTVDDAENAGEMVPAPIIARFLRGVAEDRALAQPGLGLATQVLENPLLREHHGLEPHESGLLVTRVEDQNSAHGVLAPGDVLLAIDGHDVANNGTVKYAGRFRTRYDVVLGTHFVGERISVRFARAGDVHDAELELQPRRYLVPRNQYDRMPSYLVYGGLVFQPLTRDFLSTWNRWWEKAPKELLAHYYRGHRVPEREGLVVLSQVLADVINVGYGPLYWETVLDVNGEVPVDMPHFVRLVDAAGERVQIRMSSLGSAVFDTAAARHAGQRILDRYRIPADRSPDLPRASS